MKELSEIRESINKIDKDLTKLYEKRMELVKDVAAYKKANNMEIFDSSRENEVIESNLKNLTNQNLEEYYKDFIQLLMDQSKEIQKELVQE